MARLPIPEQARWVHQTLSIRTDLTVDEPTTLPQDLRAGARIWLASREEGWIGAVWVTESQYVLFNPEQAGPPSRHAARHFAELVRQHPELMFVVAVPAEGPPGVERDGRGFVSPRGAGGGDCPSPGPAGGGGLVSGAAGAEPQPASKPRRGTGAGCPGWPVRSA